MGHIPDQMVYEGSTPWHGLGVEIQGDESMEEIQKLAGLDWRVKKAPLYVKYKGKTMTVPEKKMLIREDKGIQLDIVSDNWYPVQNDEAFNFMKEFVENGSMRIHTAGSMFDGRMVWVLAKIQDGFELFNGDAVEGHLLFSLPHQYGKSLTIGFTPVRVVCQNTLLMALKGNKDMMVKLSHRHEFDPNMVKLTLGLAHEKLEKFKEAAQFLGSRVANDEAVTEYLNKLFPIIGDNKRKAEMSLPARQIKQAIERQPGAEYAKGTWWPVLNAVTYWTDHQAGRRPDTRLSGIFWGDLRKKKIQAMNMALEMAKAA